VFKPDPVDTDEVSFSKYNLFFEKTHKNEEEKNLRFFNYLENVKKIEQDNINKPLGPDAFFGLTQFSDMTNTEFKLKMNGLKIDTNVSKTRIKVKVGTTAPGGAINWVAAGKTTAIKNQGACGSCWTFSAAETVESANLMAGNNAGAQHGSEQEILDCCHVRSNGCSGGDPRAAIGWVGQVGGLELNSCYPYEGRNDACRSNRCARAYTVRAVYPIAANENSVYSALQTYGPLSIGVDAESWQNYGGGIVSQGCGNQMDHAVQLVGYQPSRGGYWVVRNSWGAGWGESGYIYLAFGRDVCGMANYVTAARA
jgi:C1A family cysteine protease